MLLCAASRFNAPAEAALVSEIRNAEVGMVDGSGSLRILGDGLHVLVRCDVDEGKHYQLYQRTSKELPQGNRGRLRFQYFDLSGSESGKWGMGRSLKRFWA